MPNWVFNTIAVKGNKNDVIAFIKKMNDKVTENDTIDTIINTLFDDKEVKPSFNSFVPMPQTYIDYDTTNYPNGIRVYHNVIDEVNFIKKLKLNDDVKTNNIFTLINDVNNLLVSSPDKNALKTNNLYEKVTNELAAISTLDREKVRKVTTHFLNKLNKTIKEYKEATAFQEKEYGCIGWYNWGLDNYGVKWNARFDDFNLREMSDDEYLFTFYCETAWAIPDAFLEKVRSMYPTLRFAVRTYEESLMFNGFFNLDDNNVWIVNEADLYCDDEDFSEKFNDLNEIIDQRFYDYAFDVL